MQRRCISHLKEEEHSRQYPLIEKEVLGDHAWHLHILKICKSLYLVIQLYIIDHRRVTVIELDLDLTVEFILHCLCYI